MSNFNEYFRSTGLKKIMTDFLDGVDSYSDVKITKLDYKIREGDDKPSGYYLENKLTAMFKVDIEYEQDGDGVIKEAEFSCPKEVDGAFIIDGAYRISTSSLGRDFECRIYNTGSGADGIVFDFNKKYDFHKEALLITNIDPNLGYIGEKSLEIPYDRIDETYNTDKAELLKLTERQGKKLQIKLDLNYRPDHVTREIIDKCTEIGDDRVHDFIVDKTIDTVSKSFQYDLFTANKRSNFYSMKARIRYNYTRYKKINMNFLTNYCVSYFKKGSSDLKIPDGANAMNLDSFKSRIRINETVAYNPTMSDLIDIADTPINGNTNLLNSLTAATHVMDDDIYFDVYDKNFNKITIPYIDYLNSKVVASEYVDYDNKSITPDNGKIEIKYHMRRKMVDDQDYDLIDLHPDFRLSEISRRIPFINYTDSVRISMGSSMLRQSVQLLNAERPLVDTGNNENNSDSILATRYEGESGKVIEVTPRDVIIEDDNGKKYKIPKKGYIPSTNGISIYSEAKVKVGDRVKNGDVITAGVTMENDTVKYGVNANVLFHAYHGLINEDAVVVSESFADKMAHQSLIDISITLKNNSALKWIAPIGTVVKFKDPVVKCKRTAVLNEVTKIINEKLSDLLGEEGLDKYTEDYELVVPNNIDQAVVGDVRIVKNANPVIPKNIKAPDYTYAETSDEVISDYMSRYNRDVIVKNYPKYISDDTIREFSIDPTEYKVVYVIKVRLITYNRLKAGDKLTNRYGCKGVISKIVPDSDMPIANGKKVEVILNPYSLISRKIPGEIMEMFLANIAIKLHENVESMKNGHMKDIMPMINKYYGNKFKDMSVQEFIKLHDEKGLDIYTFNVGSFSKFTPSMVKEWGKELGVGTQADVLMPEKELTDLDELKENLSEEEYEKVVKSMEGKFRKVDGQLMFGNMCMLKLLHCPEFSNKCTSDVEDSKDPILGRGKYRDDGQSIGEMELTVLQSRGATSFIKASRRDSEKVVSQTFLNNLLGLGMTIADDEGYRMGGSNLKEQMTRMRNKYKVRDYGRD